MDKEKTVAKNTKIEINVGLNDKNVPLQIDWKSDDNPNANDSPQIAKAMLLSMFDKKNKEYNWNYQFRPCFAQSF